MFAATGEVIVEAVQSLVDISTLVSNFQKSTYLDSIIILSCTVVVKLILFLVCRRHESVAVQVLAQDHRNDFITNTFGMTTFLIGKFFWPYTDPIGGMCIGLLLMFNWASTAYKQVKRMTGLSAEPEFLSMLTYIAYTHDPRVLAVDTVRAYYTSNNFIAEVDIILPETMKLKEAHNIGEALQIKLEQLPEVERAFVHLDYEWVHRHLDEHPSLKPHVKLEKHDEEKKSEGKAEEPKKEGGRTLVV